MCVQKLTYSVPHSINPGTHGQSVGQKYSPAWTYQVYWHVGQEMVRVLSPCCQLPPHSHINQVNLSWKSRGGKPCHLAISLVQLLSHIRLFVTP